MRSTRTSVSVLLVALVITAVTTAPALAQTGSGALSTFLDPSISSAGMGHAGAALFWEDDRNDWANPALLGYEKGIRYSHAKIPLIPDVVDDISFNVDRVALGWCGIGVSLAGKPIKRLGGYRLDYEPAEVTDSLGNVIGTYRGHETVRQFGVGVSVLRVIDAVRRHGGHSPSTLGRYVDLSLGHTWKKIEVDLLPFPSGRGEGAERDRGALLRLTPIGARYEGKPEEGVGIKFEVAGAFVQRNYTDNFVSSNSFADEVFQEQIVAAAPRLSFLFPVHHHVVWDFLKPTISLGGTWEQAKFKSGDLQFNGDVTRTGQEIEVLGLLSGRHGFVDDPFGNIKNDTWGWGAHLQYRGIIGARYDWAQTPEAVFLWQAVKRHGWTFQIDPIRLVKSVKPRGQEVASR